MGLEIKWTPKEKSIKRQIKETKKLKKNVGSTLSWMQIENIENDRVIVKHGNKKSYVAGVKIVPVNIFIKPENEQTSIVNRLRMFYNVINFKLYHSFVFNPVNLDSQITQISRRIEQEENLVIQEMLVDDLNKYMNFIRSWQELEFFMTVMETDEKKLKEKMDTLVYELERAGFRLSVLTRIDYENYTAYLFENSMINDYLFGRGAFEILAENVISENEEQSNKEPERVSSEGSESEDEQ